MRKQRPRLAFIAWTPNVGRSADIADTLGGEARAYHALGIVRRWAVPLRYAIDAARTAAYLLRRRPRAVIVTNPPIVPALIAFLYAALARVAVRARVPLVLDSHISAFGLAGDRVSERLLRVHTWLARRARSTLVTDEELAAVVRGWGGRADVVHEPPPAWETPAQGTVAGRPRMLFIGTFAGDEPLREVLGAARSVPSLDLHVTGDIRRCPRALRASAPRNVRFVGYLTDGSYRRALAEADAVLAFSTEPHSVMRTAYEAVYARRPLIVPDRPLLRELFPHAVHVAATADGIAAGMRDALRRHAELAAVADAARDLQLRRWRGQQDVLEELITGEGAGPARARRAGAPRHA
jgi:glycosyltransferase involved in cell wall biosynthesis